MSRAVGMMDGTSNTERQQTMGLIAGLISAFAVFLLGGSTVLVSWVSAQRSVSLEPVLQAPVAVIAPETKGSPTSEKTPDVDVQTSSRRNNPRSVSAAPAKSRNPTVRPRRASGSTKSSSASRRSGATETKDAQAAALKTPVESVPAPTYVLDLPTRDGRQQPVQNPRSPSTSVSDTPTATGSTARAPASGSTPAATVNPTGRGTVIIMGDANRVRLIGNRGTFGAGALPAGAYTIQATFDTDEPRMAGRVEVDDGERVRVVCIASRQTCTRM